MQEIEKMNINFHVMEFGKEFLYNRKSLSSLKNEVTNNYYIFMVTFSFESLSIKEAIKV